MQRTVWARPGSGQICRAIPLNVRYLCKFSDRPRRCSERTSNLHRPCSVLFCPFIGHFQVPLGVLFCDAFSALASPHIKPHVYWTSAASSSDNWPMARRSGICGHQALSSLSKVASGRQNLKIEIRGIRRRASGQGHPGINRASAVHTVLCFTPRDTSMHIKGSRKKDTKNDTIHTQEQWREYGSRPSSVDLLSRGNKKRKEQSRRRDGRCNPKRRDIQSHAKRKK